MAVSALDYYIHEITRLGMLEIHDNLRPSTPSFNNFQISMNAVRLDNPTNSGNAWLDSEIRDKHSYLSFQHPDKIAEAIRLFSNIQLWPTVAPHFNMSAGDIKSRLQLIVDRRNKIVHEADCDPSYPGLRWPIAVNDVVPAISFIEILCETIHKEVV